MIPIDLKTKELARYFLAICLCLSTFACQLPSQNEDAQVPTPDMQINPVVDAQTPVVDAQTSVVDAQTPVVDAQTPVVDAQTPVVDAQTPIVDAQTPVVDAQTPIIDAQTPIVDAFIYPTIDLAILPDAEIVDMAVDIGPTACDDDFTEPRPVWNQIISTNPNIQIPYPDYHTVSNNFNIVKSIQLLASIFTKAMKKLEDVKDIEGTAQNLLDPDEAQGHCICNSCGSNFNASNAQDIWNHVETQLNQIVQALPPILEEILEDKIEALQQAIDATLVSLSNTPNQVILSITGVLQTQTQQVVDYYNMNCAPPGVSISINDFNPEIQIAFGEVQTAWDNAFSAVQNVITTIQNGALSNLWNQVQTLWQTFSGVQGLGDLVSLNWNSVVQQIQTIVSDLTPLINQIQTAVTQVTNLYNTVAPIAQQIAQTIQNTLSNQLSQSPNLNLNNCNLQQMLAPLSSIPPAIQGVIESAFQQSLNTLNQLFAQTQTILLGNAGGNSLAQIANQLAPIGNLITSQIEGCHMKGSSAECVDYCASAGVFFWGPVDFFKDPKKAAGSMALMALRQLGWLDQIAAMFTDSNGNQSNPFLDGINNAIGALGNVATFLENMAELIATLLTHVDTFTEGYHLGAYDSLRPDLHVCIGYAGHGAFAQMGGLGNGNVSIGGRYTSHNLSKKHRAQFRSGGFAVSFLDHALSLAPTIEVNTQLDGWRMWDAQKPFGIPFGNASISTNDINRYDIFHLVDQSMLAGISNTPGQIAPGDFLIKDFYTASFIGNDGMTYTWPRNEAQGFGWESSIAVVSLGLNLEFKTKEMIWELPAIPIFTGVFAIPYFSLQAGIFWKHEANYLREIIRQKINEGLPTQDQLDVDIFERNMHAMQAPDLTADNGTAAYVKPGVGVILFAGFNISKVRVGIGVDLNLKINIQPSAFGGVVDFNSALQDILMSTNVPQEAPCDPVLSENITKQCSNAYFKTADGERLSPNDYACEPVKDDTSACCIQVSSYRFCAESWTGITKDACGALSEIREATKETLESKLMEKLPKRLAAWLSNAILGLNGFLDTYQISATWGVNGCERDCPDCTWSTSELQVSDLSECQQHGYCTYADGTVVHDVSQDVCLKRGSNGEISASWSPYQCIDHMDVTVSSWQGAGCSPLQSGFQSSCGCQNDDDCTDAETCNVASGRCQIDGTPVECQCGGANGNTCGSGRTCVEGACMKTCSNNDACATPFECIDQVCQHPYGVYSAEQVVNGLQNTTPPLHTISTYALTMIEFLATFGASLYIELSFKLFGKSINWRILDLHKAWDLLSSRKTWYQPGLEARYQNECAVAMGEGVTNRFPQGPTNPLDPSVFANAGVDPIRECILTGSVCRYPEDPAVWASLPPVYQDPRLFNVGNAGTLSEFITWCKADMPNHQEDPAENSTGQIVQGLTDTLHFGEDVGMDLWASNQLCIGGVHWTDFISAGPNSFDQYQCVYTNPVSGQVYHFPCVNTTEEMLGIWGCLDSNANPWASLLASHFPSIVYLHPSYGSVLDLDQIFGLTPTNYQEGLLNELQLEYSAIYANIRNYQQFGLNVSYLWLSQLSSCFDQHYAQLTETICECTQNSDCSRYEQGAYCEQGACKALVTQTNQTQFLSCPVVEMEISTGLCCGDGIVQNSGTYVEQCDDGNTNNNDGCNAQCEREGDQIGCQSRNGECIDQCPDRQVCDSSCNRCIDPNPKACQLNDRGLCIDECPAGLTCDADCNLCVNEEPRYCDRDRAGICINNCPNGLLCDADCNTCVERMPLLCQKDQNLRCIDQCPDGQSCDADCQFCRSDVPVDYGCQFNTATSMCDGRCPRGMVCDADCTTCVQDPTGTGGNGGDNGGGTGGSCQFDAQSQSCQDSCPANQTCSQNCNQCCPDLRPCDQYCFDFTIAKAKEALANQQSIDVSDIFVTCQRSSGCPMDSACASISIRETMVFWKDCMLNTRSADGVCDERARAVLFETICKRGCIGAGSATACQLDQNRLQSCIDQCPDGYACNADCQICEPTFVNGCRLDPRSGVCINECPNGQICDRSCNGCVEPVVRSCSLDRNTNECVDRCPDGSQCDSTCSACISPLPELCSTDRATGMCIDRCPSGQVCDTDCSKCQEARVRPCQQDSNQRNACVSNCGAGFACSADCTRCEPTACVTTDNCYLSCMRDSFDRVLVEFNNGRFEGFTFNDTFNYMSREMIAYDDCRNNRGCNPNPPVDLYCVSQDLNGEPAGLLGKHILYFADCLVLGGTVEACKAQWYNENLKIQICETCY